MDWSRAKSILICAFLFLDLFLGYQVYVSRTEQWVDSDTVKNGVESTAFLAQHHISLKVDIPQETPEMNYVNVEYLDADPITAHLAQPIQLNLSKNPDDFLRQMSQKVVHAEQYRLDHYLLGKGEIMFWQSHDGVPIYIAPLEVKVEKGMATGYKQTYLHVHNQGDNRQVISAYTALRSLVEKEIITANEQVEDVTLGYYGHEYDAVVQVLAPVWRIIHNGKIHYVNAFTGAVERPLEAQTGTRNSEDAGRREQG
ncbi:two-component system regulatory protein YycI [Brevibacillus massiliensis]|uniref:two-component system regulatory protein YycI n=1 Tax=Brevibacillus massiliensis TaxID=1118054 RepID=UPI0002D49357|nr:two-component system regulatory protein YycI [Brevibacillus massiliensis]